MANAIERYFRTGVAIATDDIDECTEIDFHNMIAGGFLVTEVGTDPVTELTFYFANIPGGTFGDAHTDAEPPVALTRTVEADKYYLWPQECYGAGAVKVMTNANCSVELDFCLKG